VGQEFGFSGKAYSKIKSDIWSAGLVLVNLLTATCPWYKASRTESSFLNFIEGRASLFTSGSVEQEVVDLVTHTLRLQPAKRIGSVSTLISRFGSLQALYKPKLPSPFIDPNIGTSARHEQAINHVDYPDDHTNDNDTDHEEEYSEDDGDTIKPQVLSSVESESSDLSSQ